MAAVKPLVQLAAAVAALYGAKVVGTVAATIYYERRYLPRIAGEE